MSKFLKYIRKVTHIDLTEATFTIQLQAVSPIYPRECQVPTYVFPRTQFLDNLKEMGTVDE